jgi:hypothetical protein
LGFGLLKEKLMTKLPIAIVLFALAVAVSGCASRAETVGTLGGAAVGSAASGGSAVGTAAGGVVGYEAGKVYDQKHH